ncbi:MAG: GGDEF domain-containing protein [Ruminococcus sp.]|nr:GGDEF domain-containing protein [Ruminococcus sp.]
MKLINNDDRLKIALVYSGINSEYQGKIANGVVNKAKIKRYDVAIFAPYSNTTSHSEHDYGEENIYELINYQYFDVVIILPCTMASEENVLNIINSAKRVGTPVIVVDGDYPGCNNIQIKSQGIGDITEHLITKHNVIDFIFMSTYKNEVDNDRLSEFMATINRYGLKFNEDKILYGNYSAIDAAHAIREYIDSGRKLPEAIVCANDTMAIGVIDELRNEGIYVPDDILVTGFEGIKLAHANNPSLTTVTLPYYECGEKAVDIAREVAMRPINAVMNYEMKNKVTISQSCGCFGKNLTEDNNLIRNLYSTIDKNTYYSKRLIRMGEKMTSVTTLDETFDAVREYIDDIQVDKFYICIPEKFESCIVKDKYNLTKKYKRTGYPEKMIKRVAREYGEYKEPEYFDSKLMIPAMHEPSDQSRIFFFTPIHFQDRNFGYLCTSSNNNTSFDALFNIWRMNLSIAIENSRIREELSKQSEKLEKLYVEDSLTGIYNRRGLHNWAVEIFSKAVESQREVMIFVADLDDLKPINDKFGHKQGDNAIIQVARGLQKASTNGEICARFGGDEFEVVAYDYTNEKAAAFEERFHKALEEYNERSGMPYKVSASCGYYVSRVSEDDDFDSLIFAADKEMYKNKSEKKQRKRERMYN